MKHTTLPAWPGQTPAAPGAWRLVPGRAMSLMAGEGAVLKAVEGGLWVTLSMPAVGPANDSGDFFLLSGQSLSVPAGAHVVMEPWARDGRGDAHFDWHALPVAHMAPVSVRWQVGVRQPLTNLRAGLAAVGAAVAGLVTGLAGGLVGFAADLIALTARILGFRALMAVSNAPKAQSRIS
jgi:hypothetical protein